MIHPWNDRLFGSLRARIDRLPHALLLHGPRGVGKLALAERTAQLLLCESAVEERPCGACQGCRWFKAGSHPDFRRLEPEALAPEAPSAEEGEASAKRGKPSLEIKVDQVRELGGFVNLQSHRGGRRVALVHPAEDMNLNAANALLKALEEPPPAAVFVLVSHRPARLLPTIRSRCVAVPVPIPDKTVALAWLAAQGRKDAERWLAYAGGAPVLALDYAARAEALQPILSRPSIVDDRDDLEPLAEALQKIAIDRALTAFGLPPKYQTGATFVSRDEAYAWLRFARNMGRQRALCRHPLNPKLFSAELLARMPQAGK